MGLIEFALQTCRKHAVNVSPLPRYLVIIFVLPGTRVEYAGKEHEVGGAEVGGAEPFTRACDQERSRLILNTWSLAAPIEAI